MSTSMSQVVGTTWEDKNKQEQNKGADKQIIITKM